MASSSKSDKALTLAYLKRIVGDPVGELIPLVSKEITIGRSKQTSKVYYQDVNVSRTHCLLKFNGKDWFISDLKSMNGTYLNEVKLDPKIPYRLKDGFKIHLGNPEEAPVAYMFLTKKPNEQSNENNNMWYQSSTDFEDTQSNRGNPSGLKRRSDSEISDMTNTSHPKKIASSSAVSPIKSRIMSSEDVIRSPLPKVPVEISDTDNLSDCSVGSMDSLKTRIRKIKIKELRHKIGLDVASASTSSKKKSSKKKKKDLESQPSTSTMAASDAAESEKDSESLLNENKILQNCDAHQSDKEDLKVNKITAEVHQKIVEDGLLCIICNEAFVKATALNCSHTFCNYCISVWKKKQKKCPVCREKITSDIHVRVLDDIVEKLTEKFGEDYKDSRKQLILSREKSKVTQPKKKPKRSRRLRSRQRNASSEPSTSIQLLSGPTSDGLGVSITLHGTALEISPDDSDFPSDFSVDFDDSDADDILDSAYYGGYGLCYNCGTTGHWSNECPYS
ncbi:e3 ubiquitin-protein ligase rnf8 [Caerostris darwini]|uniref:E3 ubiquitin-protein ligase CHFR n=1 Tax=Caerostris darwini TaxID=1538125 RepID=A0AAV4P991_9ARAC|nr:e3 ubiquitin-protein ligase rnf8 [Caerostris darwini]